MSLLRRLDDLDTRVIGRGDPNWNSLTPKPWTPGMRPLIPARGSYFPEAWVSAVSAVVVLVLMLISPPDYTVVGVLFGGLIVVMYGLLSYRTRFSESLAAAAVTVSTSVPVDRSWWVAWVTAAPPTLLLAALMVLIGIDGDAGSFWFVLAMLVGGTLGIVGAERRMTRWEDAHGVELLRTRKWRHKGLYVRPRI